MIDCSFSDIKGQICYCVTSQNAVTRNLLDMIDWDKCCKSHVP